MLPVRGEPLGVVTNWPPSLEAALQRWGTISPKAPCLTSLDTAGKPLYVLTYGEATPPRRSTVHLLVGSHSAELEHCRERCRRLSLSLSLFSLPPSLPCLLLPLGKLWSRSIKLAYNILHKLGSKQEPMVRPGDRVSLTPPPL